MRRLTGRILFIAIVSGLTADPMAHASQNLTNHGVVWAVSYDGDFLPNHAGSDPAWTTLFVGSGASATVSGGILTMTNGAPSITYAQMNNTAYWDGASGGTRENTIEFRMRSLNSQNNTQFTGRYFWGDGQSRWFLEFDDNRVRINSSPFYAIDTTVFHTYRVVSSNGLADLYIDNIGNQATPVISGAAGQVVAQNFTFFGHDSAELKGRTEWDYVRWTNAGAFTVPEPSVLGLAAIAGLFASFVIRRRR
jgi:hypothetical protein